MGLRQGSISSPSLGGDFIKLNGISLSNTHMCGMWLRHPKLQFIKTLIGVLYPSKFLELCILLVEATINIYIFLESLILFLEVLRYYSQGFCYKISKTGLFRDCHALSAL